MSAITAIRTLPRLPAPQSAPPHGTLAWDGWAARLWGEPRLHPDLTVADAGEWLEGWDAAHESALGPDGLCVDIWVGEHVFD